MLRHCIYTARSFEWAFFDLGLAWSFINTEVQTKRRLILRGVHNVVHTLVPTSSIERIRLKYFKTISEYCKGIGTAPPIQDHRPTSLYASHSIPYFEPPYFELSGKMYCKSYRPHPIRGSIFTYHISSNS